VDARFSEQGGVRNSPIGRRTEGNQSLGGNFGGVDRRFEELASFGGPRDVGGRSEGRVRVCRGLHMTSNVLMVLT